MKGWTEPGKGKGYTVIELLIAAVIAAILVGAAIPSFLGIVQSSRLEAAALQIMSDVRAARSKAISSGWQYRIFGFNVGASSTYKNQYRFMARKPGQPWPSDTVAPFVSGTQMAGPWININTLYPGVKLNPQDGTPRFWVAFDARGVRIETDSFDPFQVVGQAGGAKSLRVSTVGSVWIE